MALLRHTKYGMLFWYFNKSLKEKYRRNITGIIAAERKNRPALAKLPLGFRGSVIVNQTGKMAENSISLINAGPRLNAGLEKTLGQNCRILNKRRVRLIEKIRYMAKTEFTIIGSRQRLLVKSNNIN